MSMSCARTANILPMIKLFYSYDERLKTVSVTSETIKLVYNDIPFRHGIIEFNFEEQPLNYN